MTSSAVGFGRSSGSSARTEGTRKGLDIARPLCRPSPPHKLEIRSEASSPGYIPVLPDTMMIIALERITAALKLLKQAKRRGVDVKPMRPLVDHCARALKSKDYAGAIRFADEVARYAGGDSAADIP